MEAWEISMKKILEKGKQKPQVTGFVIGTVVKPIPTLTISIGEDILLDHEDIVIANQMYLKHSHQSNDQHTPILKTLGTGDKVILISDARGQQYCLIDKEGE